MVSWLRDSIGSRHGFVLGELTVEPIDGGWRIRGPRSGSEAPAVEPSPSVVRQHVRYDDASRYRPLSGARTVPSHWQITVTSDQAVFGVVDVVYPLAIAHIDQAATGSLRPCSLAETLPRQSGRYEDSSALTAHGRRAAVAALCDNCVRTPQWSEERATAAYRIPCPEPCSVMVALCREAAIWEQDPPPPSPIDLALPFAALDVTGNEMREAWLAQSRTPVPAGGN